MTATIFEIVETALNTLTGVAWAQNTYQTADGADLPDTFLVYTLVSSPLAESADDDEVSRSYRVQVSAYSRNGLVGLPDVDGAMKAAGFRKGPMVELPFNPDDGHYHLATDYFILLVS